MKTIVLNIAFLILFSFSSRANMDCIWESNRSGVTIRYIAPCSFSHASLDSFLAKTVFALNRQDTTLKVLVLVNNGRLSYSGSAFSDFISVGYDTLRDIDDDFIFKYYWHKEGGGSIPFDTKNNPIDINSSNDKTVNTVGIKIIYDRDYRQGDPDWSEVSELIIYAVNNVEAVRHSQAIDTVRYNTNGWYVSLMTLDTFKINEVLGKKKSSREDVVQTDIAKGSSKPYLLIVGFSVLVVLTLLVLKRKHVS